MVRRVPITIVAICFAWPALACGLDTNPIVDRADQLAEQIEIGTTARTGQLTVDAIGCVPVRIRVGQSWYAVPIELLTTGERESVASACRLQAVMPGSVVDSYCVRVPDQATDTHADDDNTPEDAESSPRVFESQPIDPAAY